MTNRTQDELAVAVQRCLDDGMTSVEVLDLVARAIFRPQAQPAPELASALRVYTLTQADVGKTTIRAFGRTWPVADFMGKVLQRDVGKHVHLAGDNDFPFLQVENEGQFHARLIHDGSTYALTTSQKDAHRHSLQGQTLRHSHEGGALPHGYYEHPEDAQ